MNRHAQITRPATPQERLFARRKEATTAALKRVVELGRIARLQPRGGE